MIILFYYYDFQHLKNNIKKTLSEQNSLLPHWRRPLQLTTPARTNGPGFGWSSGPLRLAQLLRKAEADARQGIPEFCPVWGAELLPSQIPIHVGRHAD